MSYYFVYRRSVDSASLPVYLKRQDGSQATDWTARIDQAERILPNGVVTFVEDTSRLRRENPGKLILMCDDGRSVEFIEDPAIPVNVEAVRLEDLRKALSSAREDIRAIQASLATERERAQTSTSSNRFETRG